MTDKVYNAVGWFEIPVADMARAQAFYEHVFGVSLQVLPMPEGAEGAEGHEMRVFPMHEDAIGATGALVCGKHYESGHGKGIKVYFTAPDITEHLARVKEKGGVVLEEKFSIGEYGYIGMAQDPDGNVIGLHEMGDA